MTGCDDTDSSGRELLRQGAWNSNETFSVPGGQGMHFHIANANVLGTTITIESNLDGQRKALILPAGTADFVFTHIGQEPFDWNFNVSTESDAFVVTWCLYSTWIPQIPVVDSIDPPSGTAGMSVVISGSGFGGTTEVQFGAQSADITGSDQGRIRVTAPDGEGTIDVTVVTPAGTSAISDADRFTYVGPPAVTAVSPQHGSSGDSVTITGRGFTTATSVGFGVVNVDADVRGDTEMIVTAPDGQGTVDITVTGPGGTSAVSLDDQFTYVSLPIVADVPLHEAVGEGLGPPDDAPRSTTSGA